MKGSVREVLTEETLLQKRKDKKEKLGKNLET